MADELTLELARIFINAWDEFTDNADEALNDLLTGSPLLQEHMVTPEDKADGGFEEWEVDDIVYVLSDLGKQAMTLVAESEKES